MSTTTITAARIGLALAIFLGAGAGARAGGDERIKLDCGVNALYVLLHLEGKPVSIDRLVSALPAPHPEGHSMAELAAAARSLGLPLEGVRFAKGDSRPDKPMIAFLKDARGGHFVVLRPVGSMGTMIQVIDPPYPSWITDSDRLLIAGAWTDRVLLPRAPWWSSPGSVGLMILACAAILAALIWGRGRSRHRPSREAEAPGSPIPAA